MGSTFMTVFNTLDESSECELDLSDACHPGQEKTLEVSSFLFLNLRKDSNFLLKKTWKINTPTIASLTTKPSPLQICCKYEGKQPGWWSLIDTHLSRSDLVRA